MKTKLLRSVDNPRFQVFADDEQWNYAAHEGEEAKRHLAELKKAGRKATMWDTKNNGLGRLLGF